ncbi:MAG TPA: alcohol dehydrogenase catalytic domain-containing protein [Ornithinimicrobium sp.]|uniref:zinc-dependent alcohol dehydrogenase n=1 Tax=Ornithinimicrobium sp. TaxID=1977084 RepID=UPI002B4A8825|nr:alcohol dehydrogenase catalytic domain-containing protein [Ornithinimicrobium sp.]HKJ11334.1 alcohol dehydrogenase catalytic domain-containing protein [Ornithinimicrobium sp.]
MTDIRRVRITGLETIEISSEAPVSVQAHEVRVRTVNVGLCGSDTHALHGRHPLIPIPYYPGHEATGVVIEVGSQVSSVAEGERVVVEPTLPCDACKQCRRGTPNLCENLEFFGCGYRQGGMADEFVVRADRLHRIPDDMDDLSSALVEPLATPVHAGRIAGPLRDRAVVVLGAGTIGLLMLAVARYQGARRVVVTDPLALKREAALAHGADAAFDATAEDVAEQVLGALGESADVVFDCVAVEPTVRLAIRLASKGGTVAIVGVPSADVSVPTITVQDTQVRLQGSATYTAEDYDTAFEMLRAGAVRADEVVTAQFPLAQVEEAFAALDSGEHLKVVMRP